MKSARFMTKASVVAVVLAALISTIVFVQNRMNEIRERRELVDTSIAENAPPVVAFTTVALGSFRGLVADALWLRSAKMKEEGNYFEMVQLASWIVKLQPRFTGAHAYLAWNMAYNVSVTFNDFEDRWRWVQRGIELLRDEALVYNPGDPTLFKELGWIYQHKLGQEMDDANRYYKVQLAKQMLAVLGRYPVVWERWAEAPVTHAALMTSLGPAAQDLKSILIEYDTTLDELQKTFRDAEGELDDPLAEVLAENGIWEQLELYFRARWMREGLKLDPGRIWRLNEKYGELDWRLPEAHAIYWATRGLEEASEGVDIACERMIFQGLAAAFRGGRLIFLKDAEALEITPNINVVDAVNERYLDTIEQHPENSSIESGYENFMVDAVVTLYSFGREQKAADYYDRLRERFSKSKYRAALNQFVLRELAGDISSATFDQGQATVQGFLFRMYYALALGDFERGEAFHRLAQQVWRKYMNQVKGSEDRRGLPPFDQMKRTMLNRCLNSFPEILANRLRRAVEEHVPMADAEVGAGTPP